MMPSIFTQRKCEICEFAMKTGNDLFCKRFPPKVLQVVRPGALAGRPEFGMASVYPMVTPDEFCGEFKRCNNGTH